MVEALFESSVVGLGGRYDEAVYATIPAAYQGRAYHNFDHVARVLETFRFLADGLAPQDTARGVLALIFHDAVYDPRASDNEAQSAAFARRTLAPLGIGTADLDEIERLILVTRDHRAADPLGALVADADLAILAAPPDEYDAYAAAIRTEYAFVPDDRYRQGRSQVLESLRTRKLFTSDRLDEARAKVNLGRELATLANSPD